ncbi:MAG: PD-(D/E)XK nuclease family protein [Candidatus Thermoplasmatota archaeon]
MKGFKLPTIFPSILSQMDSVIKKYAEKCLSNGTIPQWFPVFGTLVECKKTLKAKEPRSGLTLTGKLDALVKLNNGSFYIVDYKTGNPKEEVPIYYQTQLDGYAYLLEQNGYAPIEGGMLLYFTPQYGKTIGEKLFPFNITPIKTLVNSQNIVSLLIKAKEIISKSMPPSQKENCEICNWRKEVQSILNKKSV